MRIPLDGELKEACFLCFNYSSCFFVEKCSKPYFKKSAIQLKYSYFYTLKIDCMQSDDNTFYREDDHSLVKRYEKMRREKTRSFFDVHEFENIIDYYLEMNRLVKASIAVKCGLTQHPGSVSIQIRKANLLIDKGKYQQALNLLSRFSVIEPSNYEIFISIGTALNLLGKTSNAIRNFDHALSLDPDDKDEVASLIGFSLQEEGSFDKAVRYFKMAYELNPSRKSYLYEMAFCYDQLGNTKEAILSYEEFLNYRPFNDLGWYNLGVAYSRAENLKNALDAFDYAIALNESNSSAIFNKANILVSMKKYETAIETFKEFLQLENDDLKGLLYLAECYENLGDEQMALHYYSKARKVDPESPELLFGMGMLELKKDNLKDSREYFRKALTFDNENPDFWYALAKTYELQNNKLNAIETVLKAIHFDSYEKDYWLLAARLYSETGALNESVKALKRSLTFLPDEPSIQYQLAIYYFLSNKSSKAYTHFEKGLKKNYDLHRKILKGHGWILSLKKVEGMINKFKSKGDDF